MSFKLDILNTQRLKKEIQMSLLNNFNGLSLLVIIALWVCWGGRVPGSIWCPAMPTMTLVNAFTFVPLTIPLHMEKELMYSSSKLKNRVADMNDSVMYCMNAEAIKPAFMRKKVSQGRNSDSQSW